MSAIAIAASLPSADIEVGVHHTAELFGMTFNVDTIWTTLIAGGLVLGLGFFVASRVTSGVPGKIQLVWESIVNWISQLVQDNIGKPDRNVIQLAIMLFTLILVSNWLELIPSEHYLPAPTSDLNLTLALALIVIFGVHVRGIRAKGLKGYVKHYFEPYAVLFPLKLIEEIVKPFTLALRLFGNIFAGGILVSLIALLGNAFGPAAMVVPNAIWKTFDLFIGLIQAFIFALLTILYFSQSMEMDHEDEKANH